MKKNAKINKSSKIDSEKMMILGIKQFNGEDKEK